MTETSLLAQLTVTKFSNETENIATEALAYILRRYPRALEAFQRLCTEFAPGLGPIARVATQAYAAADQAIPDLVGYGAGGQIPLLVEAKFWAGLTPNQPVTYLKRLPEHPGTLLLFVAPERRLASLWPELVHRAQEAFGPEACEPGGGYRMRVGPRTMALVSWRLVTNRIEDALRDEREDAGLADLRQVVGLCEYQDTAQFLPLTSEELSGTNGQRMLDFVGLIGELTEQMRGLDMVSTNGLMWAASTDSNGRYLMLRGWQCFLHINYWRWASQRATPLWLQITDQAASRNDALSRALESLRSEPRQLFEDDGKIQFAVLLPDGEEKDTVLTEALRQIKRFHDLLPDGPGVAGDSTEVG